MKRQFNSLLQILPALLAVTTHAAVRYVNVGHPSPLAPFTSWATAATNIQQAVAVAVAGDEVLVTNGVYRTGGARVEYGEITNRVMIAAPITVRSVNGPLVTLIEGNQTGAAIRCAYVANGAVLAGFTLTNGAAHSQSSEYGYETTTGGGVWCEPSAVVSNCVITGNSVQDSGGGAYGGTLKGCALFGNSAPNRGGGAASATLINCTLTDNSAAIGGGADACTLQNSIVYFNRATMRDANSSGGTLDFCCTTPLPAAGVGNLSSVPQLADRFHLAAASPCRGAGNAAFVSGRDLDGQLFLASPSIGCDEYVAGLSGALSVAIQVVNTNVAAGFPLELTGTMNGFASVNFWDFGDGNVLSNQLAVTHSWTAPGDYPVVFRAYNVSNPGGVSATVTVHVVTPPVHYVARNNATPVAPYTSWATAATNLQDAIDAVTTRGAFVLATNGVYETGGRDAFDSSNRVAVLSPLRLQSVNGPEVTIIHGLGSARCVALAAGATLNGFTLTNGSSGNGAGVYCASPAAVVTNCVLAGNGASSGGGAYQGTFNDCTFTGNNGANSGGGAVGATLNNCQLLGNSSSWVGGGAYLSSLTGCTLRTNNAFFGGGAEASWLMSSSLIGNTAVGGGGVNGSTVSLCVLATNSSQWYGGGGARESLLNDCTLNGNSSDYGGGAENSRFLRCVLAGNYASEGGGANNSFLTNSTLSGNWSFGSGGGLAASTAYSSVGYGNAATNHGGGAYSSRLLNCTFTANTATFGGGVYACDVTNSVVYFNSALVQEPNFSGGTLNFCCTLPLPPAGTGNLTNAPQLADRAHLSSDSPCRAAGNAAFTVATDFDGDAWANPPAIGADEFVSGSITGALSVGILAAYTNVATGYAVPFTAQINGRVSSSQWDFADGGTLTNQLYAAHAWATAGDYPVVLRAFNGTFPGGISATVTVHVVTQPVHYVARDNPTPVAPFATWNTAATNIQDAVDVATTIGALVLVTNGVYDAGGGMAAGNSNRVVVLNPITVRSVNGPAATVIDGASAARGAYLADGANLAGLTLTNGASASRGGGVYCNSPAAVISNCVLIGNISFEFGGGAHRGSLVNCSLLGNTAYIQGGGAYQATLTGCTLERNGANASGGGAFLGTLRNCVLTTNTAFFGGGADTALLEECRLGGNVALGGGGANSCVLNGCTVETNTAASYGGGGVRSSTLNRCMVRGNRADYGGGAESSTLEGCVLRENVASLYGGGASSAALNNCALWGNAATNTGGACASSTLNNCTLTGNRAALAGGGATDSTLNNCIVFHNLAQAGANYWNSTLNHCCTTPLPAEGLGNLTSEPQLADPAHVSAGSPCRDAGNAAFTSGRDVDGEAWSGAADIGCDEFVAGAITGPLTVTVRADYTNVAAGFPVQFIATINGHAASNRWDFGDGTNVMNELLPRHAFGLAGDYAVVVLVYNESFPAGISATSVVHVIWQPTHHVSLASTNPVPPFFDWSTAATNIQQAADVAYAGGTVLVSNGVYETGSRAVYGALSNRVVLTSPVLVTSVNGASETFIVGSNALRCVYLGGLAALSGFTLTNGSTLLDGDGALERSGGALWCESTNNFISNCVVVANSASHAGGAAYRGTLVNCTVARNQAPYGGGVHESLLLGCQVVSNSATLGGGGYAATFRGCVLSNNYAEIEGGGTFYGTLTNCVIQGNRAHVAGGTIYATVLASSLVSNTASWYSGAAWGCNFTNCTFIGNSGTEGGGARASTLSQCTLTANTANYGGGVDSCTVERCTLTLNTAGNAGGGASGSTLFNCLIASNSATDGGGAYYSVLNNCVVVRNTASVSGGGAREGTLINCTVTLNGANESGGTHAVTHTNCIVQGNVANVASNDYSGGTFSYCSTLPLPPGPGNFTNSPALVDPLAGNFHLAFGSLGINAGYTPAAPPGNDCSDLPRLIGPVDLGAYEYQSPASQLSFYWLAKYGLPANGTADALDTDGDGVSNSQEWRADSNPTNALSRFQLVTITNQPAGGLDVIWQSSSWRTYWLERGTNLADAPAFQTLATGIAGQAGATTFNDPEATNAGPYFYRVGLEP